MFVSTADPEKEPPLVNYKHNLVYSGCQLPCGEAPFLFSDDDGALLPFEAMAEAASLSSLWVPFFRFGSLGFLIRSSGVLTLIMLQRRSRL
ncbi:hypothetical protein Nepgr_028627 [Nepenthes gracilis]|uniref:Uncharacterized protein n=1 Tax=Nepenthes gracilis TaxID=150966 RepID=A0AAD3TCM0_NEPGR|nr:hypothetical protein Nepgr_028627 [Nepenthes gracilis]